MLMLKSSESYSSERPAVGCSDSLADVAALPLRLNNGHHQFQPGRAATAYSASVHRETLHFCNKAIHVRVEVTFGEIEKQNISQEVKHAPRHGLPNPGAARTRPLELPRPSRAAHVSCNGLLGRRLF